MENNTETKSSNDNNLENGTTDLALRKGEEGDKNFILATMLRSLYYGGSVFSDVPKDVFMGLYHKILQQLLDRPDTEINVACLKDAPEVILGYSIVRRITEMPILDFVYVKKSFRKVGIGKSLVPETPYSVTHLTALGKTLKPKDCPYNPFLL